MLNESHFRKTSALMLQWHAGASTIGFESFQAWCLALLKPRLRFDGAIWGTWGAAGPAGGQRIDSFHLHRVAVGIVDELACARAGDFDARHGGTAVLNVCIADPPWQAPEHAQRREHARRWGLTNTLLARTTLDPAPGQQFVMLIRKSIAHRFSIDETATFELLAPHMVQAHATARKLRLEAARAGDRRSAGGSVAMVDRAGMIHDQHAQFLPMLRREWSDWPGTRLPEPLLEMTARRFGTPWRFIGAEVTADFVPVDTLDLVTVRPRHIVDTLTAREYDVAQRYAGGDNFRGIAEALNLAPATVRSHLRNVFCKLHVRNKQQLALALR